ncbi:unnamed protein product [Boreogadus saida]
MQHSWPPRSQVTLDPADGGLGPHGSPLSQGTGGLRCLSSGVVLEVLVWVGLLVGTLAGRAQGQWGQNVALVGGVGGVAAAVVVRNRNSQSVVFFEGISLCTKT